MELSSQTYPALGAIAAAIIAGAISFVSTVLSKDQKTSEFRQAWIDALSRDLAIFVSLVDLITSYHCFKKAHGHDKEKLINFLETQHDDVRQMGASYHQIRLRLNPKEHAVFLIKLKNVLSIMSDDKKAFDPACVDKLIDELVADGQVILKKEWKRVKRGELAFVITKYVSLVLFLLAVCSAIAVITGHINVQFSLNSR